MNYERDPDRIYQQSFAAVRRETSLSGFPLELRAVVERMVHACGMPDIADDLRFSSGFAAAVNDALSSGTAILCDSTMTAAGIIADLLPEGCRLVKPKFDDALAASAKRLRTTRSAALAESWRNRLQGSIVAVGNAPTALFRLLEMIDQGAAAPAAVIGFPVGFVGAAESKQELIRRDGKLEYLALQGRRGGSAMAAAAVNALMIEAQSASGRRA